MRRIAALCLLLLLGASQSPVYADISAPEADSLFHAGNALCKEGSYVEALRKYDTILQGGLESGPLYYNIGNCFLALKKPGYAILFYERAMRIMPHDSDLRSNLAFALERAGRDEPPETNRRRIVRALLRPVRSLSRGALTMTALAVYMFTTLLIALFILNPLLRKRLRFVITVLILVSLYLVAVCGMRYHREVGLVHGVVVAAKAPCSYEPIEKSATYFTLREGAPVRFLSDRGDWQQVESDDGKVGWAKRSAVERI